MKFKALPFGSSDSAFEEESFVLVVVLVVIVWFKGATADISVSFKSGSLGVVVTSWMKGCVRFPASKDIFVGSLLAVITMSVVMARSTSPSFVVDFYQIDICRKQY